ncbi:MAG: META domain-containing protein [Acidimicrobiia bacterium]|nr:META domain-containing protein [Acidimicrobiia bacterium]
MAITRRLRIVANTVAAIALLAATGCGGDHADTRSQTEGMPSILQELQNDEWLLDHAASTPRIRSTHAVTLNFGEHAVHGTGPCNVYRASLDIAQHSVEDHSITIRDLAGTKRSCGRALDQAEAAYFAALQAVRTVDVDRDPRRLTLTAARGDVHLELRAADTDGKGS